MFEVYQEVIKQEEFYFGKQFAEHTHRFAKFRLELEYELLAKSILPKIFLETTMHGVSKTVEYLLENPSLIIKKSRDKFMEDL